MTTVVDVKVYPVYLVYKIQVSVRLCSICGESIICSVLNYVPRPEDVLGEWMYSSTHS